MNIDQIMRLAPVIPVLTIDDVDEAVALAKALVDGGLRALEVTLRTPAALDAIRVMSSVEGAVVGAGTVLNPQDLDAALAAGARFVVSPGLTEPLAHAALASEIAFLPGTATAGDVMRGFDLGLTHFKFFPAVASGGIPALKAICAPLSRAYFCPTGGITHETAEDWLCLDQVLCVGGSWLGSGGGVAATMITEKAKAAANLYSAKGPSQA